MTAWLRPAQPTDAGRIGGILWERASVEPSAFDLFSCAEAIACCGRMIDMGWVTVAVAEDGVAAFIARNGAEIEALYVAGAAMRQGLGELLVQNAKTHGDMLRLWVHPDNAGARRFYRRLGFADAPGADMPVDGAGAPGVEMIWMREAIE